MNQTHPDQTDGGWPNFTISAKFHNPGIPEILGIPGFRAVSRCLIFGVLNGLFNHNFQKFGLWGQNVGVRSFTTLSLRHCTDYPFTNDLTWCMFTLAVIFPFSLLELFTNSRRIAIYKMAQHITFGKKRSKTKQHGTK